MNRSANLTSTNLKSARSEIQWPPRVPKAKLRRLYQADAQGIVDAELLDDVKDLGFQKATLAGLSFATEDYMTTTPLRLYLDGALEG